MHGNTSTPAFVGELACAAANRAPTVVALEIPTGEQAVLTRYVGSAGGPADRKALVAGNFWSGDYQDGRRSEAMVKLIEKVRQLKQGGAKISVLAFDAGTGTERDTRMAEALEAAFAAAPASTFLVLAGNFHTRRTRPPVVKYELMTEVLVKKGIALTALNAEYPEGSTWICTGSDAKSCGPVPVGKGAARPLGVVLAPEADGAYDGRFFPGPGEYSAPAVAPVTPAQQSQAKSMSQRREGLAAFDSKAWGRCVELLSSLDGPDDAYNAACCSALAGNADRAFALLERALSMKPSAVGSVATDADLASLKTDPRWEKLIAKAKVDAKR